MAGHQTIDERSLAFGREIAARLSGTRRDDTSGAEPERSPVTTRSMGTLNLYYGRVLVGEITDPFQDQRTWFGYFTSRLPQNGNEMQRRLAEFVTFCERWHARLKSGDNPDADEFDAFGEIIRSGLWETEDRRGHRSAVEGWPVFIKGEVTWA